MEAKLVPLSKSTITKVAVFPMFFFQNDRRTLLFGELSSFRAVAADFTRLSFIFVPPM